ncbi:MAG: hypothetical protein AABZ12_08180 [Planctomycetota bacterium]
MLLQVDPQTFAMNLMLIIGAVILLSFGGVVLFFGSAVLRAMWAAHRWREGERKWLKASRRADGRRYPAATPGICGLCLRGGRRVYHEYGLEICPACYEHHWRQKENWPEPAPNRLERPTTEGGETDLPISPSQGGVK